MLGLYDELRRRQRSVRRFARVLFDQLRVERGTDRGSETLIQQTAFLGLAFLAYQRAAAASGGMDEHRLRDLLLAQQPTLPFEHVVIAVADHPTDPRGLWPADFDLLGRLEGVGRLDVVMTDESHDAGFRERLEQELPGVVEVPSSEAASPGTLIRPSREADVAACFVSRDREEELRDVVRAIIDRGRETDGELAESTAIVFHRPLPYLYLAQQTLGDARVPYQAFDALPLAAEPYAALLDLALAAARTDGSRDAMVGLLRSALIAVAVDGTAVTRREVSDLDAVLRERRATGVASGFEAEVSGFFGKRTSRQGLDRRRARRAARAAAACATELGGFRTGRTASEQVGAIAAFLRRHEAPSSEDALWVERHKRARAAVLGVLDGLALAYRRHDDRAREPEAISAAILHAIEARTFAPRTGLSGVHLVDAVAARFGAFYHVHLVGLVETDWPERPRRSVFYSSGLLTALSWPQESDQMAAQQAAFRDLLGLAARTTRLHAFQLEGDAVVAPSPILDATADLPATVSADAGASLIFDDEVLTGRVEPLGLDAPLEAWLTLRRERPPLDDPRYAGLVEPHPAQAYRVSRVDRYADCPFKYFAGSVLQLPEERDEASGLTPLERGTLLHELFEQFYRQWHADGMGAITTTSLPEAVDRFSRLTRERLRDLPPADRVLEDARLLGSLVARGVAERVFELEADAGRAVVERLVEVDLNGPFVFPAMGGLRQVTVAVKGKADRVDIFADGSIGVVDYKLGRMPKSHAVQVAVYAFCARTALAGPGGAARRVQSATYLAFGEEGRLDGQVGRSDESADIAIEDRAGQFAAHVGHIEAGRFPAHPQHVGDCTWCPYAGVCRKEYRSEDDDAADSV
jgi:RecB family exonuclease